MKIIVDGPDGAGKSIVIAKIKKISKLESINLTKYKPKDQDLYESIKRELESKVDRPECFNTKFIARNIEVLISHEEDGIIDRHLVTSSVYNHFVCEKIDKRYLETDEFRKNSIKLFCISQSMINEGIEDQNINYILIDVPENRLKLNLKNKNTESDKWVKQNIKKVSELYKEYFDLISSRWKSITIENNFDINYLENQTKIFTLSRHRDVNVINTGVALARETYEYRSRN